MKKKKEYIFDCSKKTHETLFIILFGVKPKYFWSVFGSRGKSAIRNNWHEATLELVCVLKVLISACLNQVLREWKAVECSANLSLPLRAPADRHSSETQGLHAEELTVLFSTGTTLCYHSFVIRLSSVYWNSGLTFWRVHSMMCCFWNAQCLEWIMENNKFYAFIVNLLRKFLHANKNRYELLRIILFCFCFFFFVLEQNQNGTFLQWNKTKTRMKNIS